MGECLFSWRGKGVQVKIRANIFYWKRKIIVYKIAWNNEWNIGFINRSMPFLLWIIDYYSTIIRSPLLIEIYSLPSISSPSPPYLSLPQLSSRFQSTNLKTSFHLSCQTRLLAFQISSPWRFCVRLISSLHPPRDLLLICFLCFFLHSTFCYRFPFYFIGAVYNFPYQLLGCDNWGFWRLHGTISYLLQSKSHFLLKTKKQIGCSPSTHQCQNWMSTI